MKAKKQYLNPHYKFISFEVPSVICGSKKNEQTSKESVVSNLYNYEDNKSVNEHIENGEDAIKENVSIEEVAATEVATVENEPKESGIGTENNSEEFDVFISYRRKNNGQRKAKRIAHSLEKKGYKVFLDVQSLHQGEYLTYIENAIKSSTDVILMMTEGYMDRCVNQDDVVAFEIMTALDNNKNVVLINYNKEFSFDSWPEGLPEKLDNLKKLNSLEFVTNEHYEGPLKELATNRMISVPSTKVSNWEDYKNSDKGKKVIADFERLQDRNITATEFNQLFTKYTPQFQMNTSEGEGIDYIKVFLENQWNNYDTIDVDNNNYKDHFLYNIVTHFIDRYDVNWGNIEKSSYKFVLYVVPELSLFLYRLYPDFYFPFLFHGRMESLYSIADANGLQLPPTPKRLDSLARCLYYYYLCEVMQQFRKDNNMTAAELCAYLYGFKYEPVEIVEVEDLPAPTNVWFIGGTNGVAESVASFKKWQCDPNTKKGDLLIYYEKAPVKAINGIWRAQSDGFVEPYLQYYSFTYAGSPVQIPADKAISLDELLSDEYFKEHKLVRKNMQGVSGWPSSKEDYERLLLLLSQKGYDTSLLPSADIIVPPTPEKLEMEVTTHCMIGGKGVYVLGKINKGNVSPGDHILLTGQDIDFNCTVIDVVDKKMKPLTKKIKLGDTIGVVINEAELGQVNLSEIKMIIQ